MDASSGSLGATPQNMALKTTRTTRLSWADLGSCHAVRRYAQPDAAKDAAAVAAQTVLKGARGHA
jgi:hypothetical protein